MIHNLIFPVSGVASGLLSLVTITGNFMVMISFKMDKQLQTISNYFLFSLAVADLIIGLISMPLQTVFIIHKVRMLGLTRIPYPDEIPSTIFLDMIPSWSDNKMIDGLVHNE